MKPTKTNPKSILRPELEVSENSWAVSFCKKSVSAAADYEHGFLVIQTDNKLMKRDLYYDKARADKGEPGFAMIQAINVYYPNEADLPEQFNQLIWGNANTTFTVNDIGHKTWLLDKSKVEALLQDIGNDTKNPPKFFIGGDTSMKRPGYKEHKVDIFLGTTLVFSHTPIFGAAITVAPGVLGMGFLVGTAFTLGMASIAALVENQGHDEFTAHNCATWSRQKLLNLNVPEINNDLALAYTDKIAFVTGLHIPANELDKKASEANLNKAINRGVGELC